MPGLGEFDGRGGGWGSRGGVVITGRQYYMGPLDPRGKVVG